MADQFMPVLITLAVALGFAVILLGTAALLGQRTRHRAAAKRQSYESGIPVIDRAHKRISVRFYLVALIFVVLDVEVAFLYPWAVMFKKLGMFGFAEMGVFIAILFVGYVYVWKKGALEWE